MAAWEGSGFDVAGAAPEARSCSQAGVYVAGVGTALFDRSIPPELWTHEAHIAAALYLVMVRRDLDAFQVMPGLIRRYNETIGVPNTDQSGFHATITEVYLRGISALVAWLPRGTTPGRAFQCLMASPVSDRDYPLYFYSRERLLSPAARRQWLEPDLRPLSWTFFLCADGVSREPRPELHSMPDQGCTIASR